MCATTYNAHISATRGNQPIAALGHGLCSREGALMTYLWCEMEPLHNRRWRQVLCVGVRWRHTPFGVYDGHTSRGHTGALL